ncbi:MAG TPA: sodium-dependent transporter [Opitutus sp.]|nr:sodium-dependent transporter [Opitutus sp.]
MAETTTPPPERWSSRVGIILAVAGSAVGLGNFLRFPGLAAQYGGASFLIAYFIALLLIGVPIGWAEWTLGRRGGQSGFHSSPGIFHSILRTPAGKYFGIFGFLVPVMIYMYYVYVEAWCLGYAFLAAKGELTAGVDYGALFARYTGAAQDGAALQFGFDSVGPWVLIVYLLNYFFIYRGISKGIEKVCLYGMPVLIAIALAILVRVLTLGTPDPLKPDQNVLNGLGFMWNPGNVAEDLKNPQLWLAASGQIFFTLSVALGSIITYASYLKPKDDVVLSSLTAASANEFCEVGLGGLITVPAAFVFLGAAGVVGKGTFGLGFNVLPFVFSKMPFGGLFAFLFFLLLFLAAITSSLSMLQPGIAFLEEGLGLTRKPAMALLGLITACGSLLVWWFSRDLKALDTIDFWVGNCMVFVSGTALILLFNRGLGIERGWAEAHEGAEMRIPSVYKFVMRWITPAFLLAVFVLWVAGNVFGWNFELGAAAKFAPTGYVTDLVGPHPNAVARVTFLFIVICAVFGVLLINLAGKRWHAAPREEGGGPEI